VISHFWDLVKDKMIRGFDPRNVITIMTSLSGTLVPELCEQRSGLYSVLSMNGLRNNFGGRFAPVLKYAGWDGIIEGNADKPVWVDTKNEDVKIKDARTLGPDTWKLRKRSGTK
jgi:aldehyde:ferredoxin oxidoreductase